MVGCLFILVILVSIAITVEGCFISMPREFHKVPAKLIWATASAFILSVASTFFVASGLQITAVLSLAALIVYFLFRAIAFIGLAFSFRVYGLKNGVRMSRQGMLMAWIASFGDLAAVFGVFVLSAAETAQVGTQFTPAQIHGYTTLFMAALGSGVFLSIAFLLAMSSNKNKAYAFERTVRRKIMHAAIQAKTRHPHGTTGTAK